MLTVSCAVGRKCWWRSWKLWMLGSGLTTDKYVIAMTDYSKNYHRKPLRLHQPQCLAEPNPDCAETPQASVVKLADIQGLG
jgi:hypothetical protein